MAHYFLFPEKDATIYANPISQETNTGIDEILTIENTQHEIRGYYYPSRLLIKFKDNEINDVIGDFVKGDFKAQLKLYETEHTALSLDSNFEVLPLALSWENGRGRRYNNPITSDGVSWVYRDNNVTKTMWDTGAFPVGVTGSWGTGSNGGGVWYSNPNYYVTKSYGYNDDYDVSFEVTNIVDAYVSGTINNNGFIIKRQDIQEFSFVDNGTLNFFSMDTHTIYPPFLDISWDDSDYNPVSDDNVLTSGDIFVTLRNNKREYRKEEEVKFRLNVRELYPTRKFVTSSNFLDVKYFTSESYYSVIDYATEEPIISFDEHTKLSADVGGMYFKMYMDGLQAERYYKLIFKHQNNDGVIIYDDNYYFKVIR